MILISALTYREARNMAREAHLPLDSWVFIPCSPKLRQEELAGRRINTEDELIGHFSDSEIKYLKKKSLEEMMEDI